MGEGGRWQGKGLSSGHPRRLNRSQLETGAGERDGQVGERRAGEQVQVGKGQT